MDDQGYLGNFDAEKNAIEHPRAGWAEASQTLVETGEDGLVWPQFGNSDDDAWVW